MDYTYIYIQALSSYRSSEGYHQRRLKLKAEKNLQRKILLSAGSKEHWSKGSSPYLVYIASHWKDVVAENPKMNGYQVQQVLWNNWCSLEITRRRHRKKTVAVGEVTDIEKPRTKVDESAFAQVITRCDEDIKTTDSSSSIVVSPQRKANLVSRKWCLKKGLMKSGIKKVTLENPMNLVQSFQLPPGCTLVSHVNKEELYVKENLSIEEANAQKNVPSDPTVIIIILSLFGL